MQLFQDQNLHLDQRDRIELLNNDSDDKTPFASTWAFCTVSFFNYKFFYKKLINSHSIVTVGTFLQICF